MKKKQIVTLMSIALLSGATVTQTTPLLYSTRVLAEETAQSSTSASSSQANANKATSGTQEGGASASTSKVVEKESLIIPDSSVYLLQIGYEFDDGSFDEWAKGTGFLVSNQEILTTQTFADTSTTSNLYKSILTKKGDAYKTAGIDLKNEKEVDKHFIIRVVNTDGEVLKVKSTAVKNGLGLISLEKTTSSTPGIFEEANEVKTEEGTKYKLKLSAISGGKAVITESNGDLVKPPTNATGGTLAIKADSTGGEILGSPIYNDNGNIVGMVVGSGESYTVIPSSGLQTFLTNNDVKFDTKTSAAAKRAAKEKEDAQKALEEANKATIVTKELEDTIAKAEALNSDDYHEESFKTMLAALEDAKKVLANEKHTQPELDSAKSKLDEAINGLEEYTLMDRLKLPLMIGGVVVGIGILVLVILKVRKKMANRYQEEEYEEPVNFSRNDDYMEDMRRMDEADLARSQGAAYSQGNSYQSQAPSYNQNQSMPNLQRRNAQGGYDNLDYGIDITDQVAPAGLRTGSTNIPGVSFASETPEKATDLRSERFGAPLTTAVPLVESGDEETTILGQTPYLVRKSDGQQIPLTDGFIIGKERKRVHYCISGNSSISRTHAQFRVIGGAYHVEDLQSKNYTYLNGQQLPAYKAARLTDGDVVKMSDVEFIFHS